MIPIAFLLLLAARWPEGAAPPGLGEFDAQIQRRFVDGKGFGMSRIIRWSTLSHHFNPPANAKSDFAPENERERAVIDQWTREGWQTGLYVFGASIRTSSQPDFFHRALKGPGVLTENTPRAELPAWADMFPVAAQAMKRFDAGAAEHVAQVKGWMVVARPVAASADSCLRCHNAGVAHLKDQQPFQTGDALGGVMYLYRR